MTSLPRELAPWKGLLALFPEDLAGDLGRLVPRLALAVGPMRAAQPRGGGEPDGFAGIGRSGPYERLLLSEWLLADEAPEEFTRRAAMGEHAFFHLARRSPVHARSSVAIFDTGPEQLGAPRIAQLAALIVLAARAEQAGARFAWGILGAPDRGAWRGAEPPGNRALLEAVTPESVISLLAARTAVAAGPEDLAAWADRAAKSGWEDAWLVGRVGDPPWRHASLEIRDVLDPDRRALSVTARTPRSPPREIELTLPDARTSVRLLRDPFAVTAPAPRWEISAHTPASNLIFAVNGTKLFARSRSGEIVAYPVPNSPRDPAGRPKRYRPQSDGVVAAVGWVRRGVVMLVVQDDRLVFEHTSARGPDLLGSVVRRPEGLRVDAPREADPLSPLFLREGRSTEVFFLDARRALLCVRGHPSGQRLPEVSLVASEVAALAGSPTEITFVGRDAERSEPEHTPRHGVNTLAAGALPELDGRWRRVHLPTDAVRQGSHGILLGDGTFEACVGRGQVAVQQHQGSWTVHDEQSLAAVISPPPGAEVVGVHRSTATSAPELIILEEDRRTIAFAGAAAGGRAPLRRLLPAASAPILHVTVNAWRAQLAYATVAGEVVIHSLHEQSPLARFGSSA